MSQDRVPFDKTVVDGVLVSRGIDPSHCSIRELKGLVDELEERLGVRFIRMEFGIPGLKTNRAALEAEMKALSEETVSCRYAPFDGIPALKAAAATFVFSFAEVFASFENMTGGVADTLLALVWTQYQYFVFPLIFGYWGLRLFLDDWQKCSVRRGA